MFAKCRFFYTILIGEVSNELHGSQQLIPVISELQVVYSAWFQGSQAVDSTAVVTSFKVQICSSEGPQFSILVHFSCPPGTVARTSRTPARPGFEFLPGYTIVTSQHPSEPIFSLEEEIPELKI